MEESMAAPVVQPTGMSKKRKAANIAAVAAIAAIVYGVVKFFRRPK